MVSCKDNDNSVYGAIQSLVRYLLGKVYPDQPKKMKKKPKKKKVTVAPKQFFRETGSEMVSGYHFFGEKFSLLSITFTWISLPFSSLTKSSPDAILSGIAWKNSWIATIWLGSISSKFAMRMDFLETLM